MAEMIDEWANIHHDMLNEITKRFHSYNDYFQLRLVCKQWNLKLPKIPNNGNKVPWLLSPIAIDASETRDLEEKGIYHLMLPDMLQDNIIVGSSHGWLISVVVNEGTVQILNPFTQVQLDLLPPVSTLPNLIGNDGSQYILSDFHRPLDHSFVHRFLVHKVIINSAPNDDNKDLMAVAIYGCASTLVFYKPNNDRRWIKFSADRFMDVIFFEEKIYAVEKYGQLYEFDLKTKPEPMGGIYEAPPPSDVVTHFQQVKYLVGCAHNGSLLMLVRHYNELKDEERGGWETYKFDIYELKKNAKAWSRIYNLGNYILVIGHNSSVQMLASNFFNGKGNQIYFTDNLENLDCPCYHNIGIYNLKDQSFKVVLAEIDFLCRAVWVLP
ncbi:hypothetical protein PIB30_020971 [Stylosanthes scabra]|uniref:KIB1-4 beta-propeller domain-containing protein n=1 Tax=Stylosanthes scabra TaxID=79078 RepID=A0ABU6S9B5_9FABA|nr:hypothetical protein [Stylosanthes scabra]